MKMMRSKAVLFTAVILLASSCAHEAVRGRPLNWSASRQMVLVTTADWRANTGTLRTFEQSKGHWQAVGEPAPVTIGRAGSAWGIGLHPAQPGPSKAEGDGRAPAGVFAIGTSFGYAASTNTTLPYAAMSATDYCVDVSGSPLYNQLVDTRDVGLDAIAGSTEPMRRDLHADGDQRYKLGWVIEHNPQGRAGAGSCIFAHLWKAPGETTSGCTAMAEPVMQRLLAWLRPEAQPVFVLLPDAEFARLKRSWNLPEFAGGPAH